MKISFITANIWNLNHFLINYCTFTIDEQLEYDPLHGVVDERNGQFHF